jgi:hypothetical protein
VSQLTWILYVDQHLALRFFCGVCYVSLPIQDDTISLLGHESAIYPSHAQSQGLAACIAFFGVMYIERSGVFGRVFRSFRNAAIRQGR